MIPKVSEKATSKKTFFLHLAGQISVMLALAQLVTDENHYMPSADQIRKQKCLSDTSYNEKQNGNKINKNITIKFYE